MRAVRLAARIPRRKHAECAPGGLCALPLAARIPRCEHGEYAPGGLCALPLAARIPCCEHGEYALGGMRTMPLAVFSYSFIYSTVFICLFVLFNSIYVFVHHFL